MLRRNEVNRGKETTFKTGVALGKHEGIPGAVYTESARDDPVQCDAFDSALCITEDHRFVPERGAGGGKRGYYDYNYTQYFLIHNTKMKRYYCQYHIDNST